MFLPAITRKGGAKVLIFREKGIVKSEKFATALRYLTLINHAERRFFALYILYFTIFS